MSSVVSFHSWSRINKKPSSLTLVRKVVTQAENKLWWRIAVLENKSLGNLTLVDKPRPDLKVGFARHDLDIIFLGYRPFKVLLAFASLEGTKLGISLAVVPCKRNLLLLDE